MDPTWLKLTEGGSAVSTLPTRLPSVLQGRRVEGSNGRPSLVGADQDDEEEEEEEEAGEEEVNARRGSMPRKYTAPPAGAAIGKTASLTARTHP